MRQMDFNAEKMYHIGLAPDQGAPYALLTGDPDGWKASRSGSMSRFFLPAAVSTAALPGASRANGYW